MTAEHYAIENYACPHCRAVFRTAFQRCPLDGNPLQPLVGDPLSGASFADRYIIEECVGEGGMGRVYRARHQRMSRLFAIKVLFGDHAADTKMQERLAREAEAASRLSHPNVISVLDFGETDEGLLYLVMDYVDGPTLAQLIETQAPFSFERIHKLMRDMARGLSHAHKRNLIHRDFKADNVIISTDGAEETAKIVDFGIAMLNEPTKSRKLTTEGMVLGTPAVMAPEQAVGDVVDHRTDLFSLGVVLYEMLSGHLPFDGSPLEIARQNLANEVPRISQRVPGLQVDPSLEALSLSLMQKQPDDRPDTAKDVLLTLSRMEGESSREFYRSEGNFLEQAGLDPMTPIPGYHAQTRADNGEPSSPGFVSGPTEFAEHSQAGSAPRPLRAAVGLTEAVSQQPRPTQRRLALIAVIVALALGVIALVVVLASGDSTNDSGHGDTVAIGSSQGSSVESKLTKTGDDSAAAALDAGVVGVAVAEDSGATDDRTGQPEDSGDLVIDDVDPKKQRAAAKARRLKRAAERKAKTEKRRQERAAKIAEEKRKAKAKARAKADAKAAADRLLDQQNDVEKVISVSNFNARFKSIGRLVNKAANIDSTAATVAKSVYSAATASFAAAQSNSKTRAQANRLLSRARREANRIIKKAKKTNGGDDE